VEKSLANKSVGVIGLGLMGEVFSRRLIDGGQSVVGYDIDLAKGVRLADMGGRAAASSAEVARACDPIVLAVFDTSQVEDVVENHILPAVGETSRKVVLCASTCDPDRLASLGERVIPRGIRFLETPVSAATALG
jgi:3-hydroxyisobutyrate dehydrogenase-like beta-hydroxyacid dehydrogenase